jgi:hypothetical protein
MKGGLTKTRRCKEKSLGGLAALREEKNSTRRKKKDMARKGAETQRNVGWPHKDAKVQRKISLRLGDFARKK